MNPNQQEISACNGTRVEESEKTRIHRDTHKQLEKILCKKNKKKSSEKTATHSVTSLSEGKSFCVRENAAEWKLQILFWLRVWMVSTEVESNFAGSCSFAFKQKRTKKNAAKKANTKIRNKWVRRLSILFVLIPLLLSGTGKKWSWKCIYFEERGNTRVFVSCTNELLAKVVWRCVCAEIEKCRTFRSVDILPVKK